MTSFYEKTLVLETNFCVTSADTDMFSRLRLGSLLNYLIQAAIQSADSLGLGFENLTEKHLFWVLSRIDIQILKPINWYDELKVQTWPKDIVKLFYIRDFKVYNQHNELVVIATSAWLAIDKTSKRLRHVDEEFIEKFKRLCDKHAIKQLPTSLVIPEGGEETFVKEVNYFDIDLNGHLTSTRYIDWMMDTFSVEFHEKNTVRAVSINFVKETFLGDKIELMKKTGESEFFFEGKNQNNLINIRASIAF